MKRGEQFVTRIERLEPSGRGVAQIAGQPVLIEGGRPEQTVRIEIQRLAKSEPEPRLARARVVDVIDAAPPAATAATATTATTACPGAPWFDVPLATQLRWKQDLALATLEAISAAAQALPNSNLSALAAERLEPLVPSPLSEGYRNKVEYSCGYGRIERIADPRHPGELDHRGRPRTIPEGFDPAVGFHPPGNWQLVQPFEGCPILPAFLTEIRRRLDAMCQTPTAGAAALSAVDNYRPWCDIGCRRTIMVRGGAGFDGVQALLVMKTGGDAALETAALDQFRAALGDLPNIHLHWMCVEEGSQPRGHEPLHDLLGGPALTVRFCGLNLRVRPASFFQTNLPAAEQLVARLRGWLAGRGCQTLWDVYCGTGSLGLSLAGSAQRIQGIEVVPAAIEDARENARANGIADATYTVATAEQTLAAQFASAVAGDANGLTRDFAVVDPPRAGLHPKALKALAAAPLAGLAYVACNPASLVHDLPALFATGYRLESLIPFDFFPHTPHLELLALLGRT